MHDYTSLENKLELLLSLLTSQLSEEGLKEVRHFISVGEYGVAFESLCAIILEAGTTIPLDAYTLISELGNQMQLERDTWEILITLVGR